MKKISIAIPSIKENIQIVESFIDNTKEKYALTDDVYGNIMIAVVESVNNAILHGNRQDKNKKVEICAELEDNQVRFIITDKGSGFDYNSLPDPTAPENIAKIGGRGVFLMKHLADEVSFYDEGRIVQLTFYLE